MNCDEAVSNEGDYRRPTRWAERCNLRPEFHCPHCDRWYCSQHWFGRLERHADHGPVGRLTGPAP